MVVDFHPVTGAHVGYEMLELTPLKDMKLIRVSGADARQFLQGQFTQDMDILNDGETVLTGWADAKGRLLFAGPVAQIGDEFWLVTPADTASLLVQRLSMFVLRANVVIETAARQVSGVFGIDSEAQPNPEIVQENRLDGAKIVPHPTDSSRAWLVGEPGEHQPLMSAMAATPDVIRWEKAEIAAGVPTIYSDTVGKFVPQMVNLDLLDAISFNKGCYSGQEIVARTHNLGRIKRRTFRFAGPPDWTPNPGEPLGLDGKPVGTVVRGVSDGTFSEALAVVPLDQVGKSLSHDIHSTAPANRLDLPYAVPDSMD